MSELLLLKKEDCKSCYKCIRECALKSIRFSENRAQIVERECVYCGHCYVTCPQSAKEIRRDTDKARALIASGRPVIVSLAPSFIADFGVGGLDGMRQALLKLGFADVEETARGARIVKTEYERMIASGEHKLIISSCCHSVNLLIQKRYPQALPYLAKVDSPMLAHAKSIKERVPGSAVVFIGPCISKKDEAEQYGQVDCVLTFDELSRWLREENRFCNTLVDRIVTGCPAAQAPRLNAENGYEDALLDTAEPFGLWVIEGDEALSREFPAQKAGLPVKLVADHHPYKEQKVRILNGGHTSMVLAAYLAGHDIIRECMEDEAIRGYLEGTLFQEIIPTRSLPREDCEAFARAVEERKQQNRRAENTAGGLGPGAHGVSGVSVRPGRTGCRQGTAASAHRPRRQGRSVQHPRQ